VGSGEWGVGSRGPGAHEPFPIPYSLFPIPYSLFPAFGAWAKKGTRRRSRSGSDLAGAPGSAPRPDLDVHNVKERGAIGAVVTGERAHAASVRRDAHALRAHEISLDGLRLVLWAICPPASAAEGEPCAGYSGFSREPCSDHIFGHVTPE